MLVALLGLRAWEWLDALSGFKRPREERPEDCSGLLSRKAVDVLKRTAECVERVGDGGIVRMESDMSEGTGEGGPSSELRGLYEGLFGDNSPADSVCCGCEAATLSSWGCTREGVEARCVTMLMDGIFVPSFWEAAMTQGTKEEKCLR